MFLATAIEALQSSQLAPLFETVVGAVAAAGSSEEMLPMPQAGFDIGARARSMWR